MTVLLRIAIDGSFVGVPVGAISAQTINPSERNVCLKRIGEMKGTQFLTRQTVNLRGTEWETPKRKSYSATIRPSESGGHMAKVCGSDVRVTKRGKSWEIQAK